MIEGSGSLPYLVLTDPDPGCPRQKHTDPEHYSWVHYSKYLLGNSGAGWGGGGGEWRKKSLNQPIWPCLSDLSDFWPPTSQMLSWKPRCSSVLMLNLNYIHDHQHLSLFLNFLSKNIRRWARTNIDQRIWMIILEFFLHYCGSGSRRVKMIHKINKKIINFIFWSAGCSVLRAEGFSCSLDIL